MKIKLLLILAVLTPTLSFAQQDSDFLYMNAYIVIADSSSNYFDLREKMFELSDKLQIEIDTMERGYDKYKNLICLPDNHDNEIYAGEYYPRRYPSEKLSLEYLDYYANGKKPTGGIIILIALISDEKKTAEEGLRKIKKYERNAFIFETKIYMGCMH